ncbi:hypothetical protein DFH09DRAFT_1290718 [Mycena vulgaris]|nr:hypothetical protein DFH09DRAFT_1290718 [Mycena vulgaris]
MIFEAGINVIEQKGGRGRVRSADVELASSFAARQGLRGDVDEGDHLADPGNKSGGQKGTACGVACGTCIWVASVDCLLDGGLEAEQGCAQRQMGGGKKEAHKRRTIHQMITRSSVRTDHRSLKSLSASFRLDFATAEATMYTVHPTPRIENADVKFESMFRGLDDKKVVYGSPQLCSGRERSQAVGYTQPDSLGSECDLPPTENESMSQLAPVSSQADDLCTTKRGERINMQQEISNSTDRAEAGKCSLIQKCARGDVMSGEGGQNNAKTRGIGISDMGGGGERGVMVA